MGGSRFILARIADLLGDAAAVVAAATMALLCGLILLEIGLRFFGTSTFMLNELGGYAIASLTFLAMAHTFRSGEMIRVHVLLTGLPAGPRRYVEVICAFLALSAFGLVTWHIGAYALRAYERDAMGTGMIEIPQWIPMSIVFVGAFLLCLQILAYGLELLIDPKAALYTSDRAIE